MCLIVRNEVIYMREKRVVGNEVGDLIFWVRIWKVLYNKVFECYIKEFEILRLFKIILRYIKLLGKVMIRLDLFFRNVIFWEFWKWLLEDNGGKNVREDNIIIFLFLRCCYLEDILWIL